MSRRSLSRRASIVLPGGNTRTTVFVAPSPPYAQRGEGVHVTDADGHRTIDLQGNFSSLVHGHRHPRVIAAARRAIDELIAVGLPTSAEVDFAEALVARFAAVEQVRIASSGTEAVMLAVRAARAFTGRAAVLRFEPCYHGFADAAVPADAPGITPGTAADLVTVPYGDVAALEHALERHRERLACGIVDLIPNRAGLRPASAAFARTLAGGLAACGALLICDEVISARLAHGGFHATYGLRPDLVAFGKLIGGGFPIGALGGRRDVMARFDPRAADPIVHGSTFNANPVSLRAGLAALALLTPAAIAAINALGDELRTRLAGLGLAPTGCGSLLKVDAGPAQARLWWALYRRGVLIVPNGLMAISTVMDGETIDVVVEAFRGAVADVEAVPAG